MKEVATSESKRVVVYEKAMRLIGRRSHSVAQLRMKLTRGHGDAIEQIESVIEELLEHDYLNDHRYARERIASCVRKREEGRRKIRARLMQDGLSSDCIREALDECYPTEREREQLIRLVDRVISTGGDQAMVLKKANNRGFSYDLVHSVMSTDFDTLSIEE